MAYTAARAIRKHNLTRDEVTRYLSDNDWYEWPHDERDTYLEFTKDGLLDCFGHDIVLSFPIRENGDELLVALERAVCFLAIYEDTTVDKITKKMKGGNGKVVG